VGGMVSAPFLSMLVVPAAWYLIQRRRHGARRSEPVGTPAGVPVP